MALAKRKHRFNNQARSHRHATRNGMAAGLMAAGLAARAQTTADLPLLSAYAWRGQILNDQAVFQPALNAVSGGWGVNAWGNYNTTDRATGGADFSEIDLTVSYGRQAGPVALSGGVIEYLFPNTDYPGTREVYFGATWANPVATPALTVYRDIDEADGAYASLALSRDVVLADDKTLSLRASLGGADSSYNDFYFGVKDAALNDFTAGATLAWTLSKTVTLKPGLQYSWLVDPEIREGARGLYRGADALVGSLMLTLTL